MLTKTYYVYILASARNGTLYTSVTNDLVRRVGEHREGRGSGFTKKYGVHRLVWFEAGSSIEGAIVREKQIKRWNRAWKINLFRDSNPNWDDLYPTIARL
ncbi:MAG: GIY-YIG nuclease family protein [Devosia sp.]